MPSFAKLLNLATQTVPPIPYKNGQINFYVKTATNLLISSSSWHFLS